MTRGFLTIGLVLAALPAAAQAPYKLPPKEVVDARRRPAAAPGRGEPDRGRRPPRGAEAYPPIALLAEPILRLGGVRIVPATGCRQRTFRYTGIQVQPTGGGAALRVPLPAGARIGLPVWSHDGQRFAFARDLADGVELWIGEAATGAARPSPACASTTSSARRSRGPGRERCSCGRSRTIARQAPRAPTVPVGPVVEETAGKVSQMATFQDLLRTPHDEDLFEHFARAQLVVVDPAAGTRRPLGDAGALRRRRAVARRAVPPRRRA